MDRSLLVCLVILAALLALSVMSRTVSSESKLGAYSGATVRRTCARLCREAAQLRATSLQDELPAMALGHNAEALARVRCASALSTEYGLGSVEGAQDLEADLREEQDASVQALAAEIDATTVMVP
jgi:hypothetical protein